MADCGSLGLSVLQQSTCNAAVIQQLVSFLIRHCHSSYTAHNSRQSPAGLVLQLQISSPTDPIRCGDYDCEWCLAVSTKVFVSVSFQVLISRHHKHHR